MPWFVWSEVRWKNYLENIALAISAIDCFWRCGGLRIMPGSRACKHRQTANQKRCSFSSFRLACSRKAAGKCETRDFFPGKMNEWGHSGTVNNKEEGQEEKQPSPLCFLMHASMIAVQLGTNWQQHPPNLWRAPLPTIPCIVTWNATISLTLFLLRWSDRGSWRLGGSHRCSRGTTNNSKIDMIPWQKRTFHVLEAAVPVVTADVRNREEPETCLVGNFHFWSTGLWCGWVHLTESGYDWLSEAAATVGACRTTVFIAF